MPGLATVLVGNDPASEVYVRNKGKTAQKLGFKSVHVALAADASEADVLAHVRRSTPTTPCTAFSCRCRCRSRCAKRPCSIRSIPRKDVDALTPANAGLLLSGRAKLVSCTPAGMMILLKEYVGDIAGLDALVIGRSLLFGKAGGAAAARRQRDRHHGAFEDARSSRACAPRRHPGRRDRQARICESAIGSSRARPSSMSASIASGCGRGQDAASSAMSTTSAAAKVAGAITPVPGGVGAMTIVCLMRNTLIAAALQANLPMPNV